MTDETVMVERKFRRVGMLAKLSEEPKATLGYVGSIRRDSDSSLSACPKTSHSAH